MPSRRNRQSLEQAIAAAETDAGRSEAHYALALFHDNNSREAEAIPHYEAALTLGLQPSKRAHCLAYLASSLYKTGRQAEALQRVEESLALAQDSDLIDFVRGLKRRIQRALRPA